MHQSIGEMAIGAGIVSVLLDFVRISLRGQLQMIAANKAILILNGFLYGYTNVFTGFIAANALTAFIERVESKVDGAIEQCREEADKLELQEAKVPDALYDSLEHAIPASNDVLQAVPDASGAFCLNQIGLAHLLTRNLILKYFAAERVDSHPAMTRVRFEELCEDLLRVILEPVEKVIKDSKVDKGSFHEIVPVGGSTCPNHFVLRNTTVLAKQPKTFSTQADNEPSVPNRVFKDGQALSKDINLPGELKLSGLRELPTAIKLRAYNATGGQLCCGMPGGACSSAPPDKPTVKEIK
ncbi:Hsp70 chaperone [Rhodotorula sphaerocarpa]